LFGAAVVAVINYRTPFFSKKPMAMGYLCTFFPFTAEVTLQREKALFI
jgi:hypothetical protein